MEAPSLSRKTMGAAISSSVAQRPSGIALRKGAPISSRRQYQADIGVMTTVGLTLFTRMLYLPSSSAETRVMLKSRTDAVHRSQVKRRHASARLGGERRQCLLGSGANDDVRAGGNQLTDC